MMPGLKRPAAWAVWVSSVMSIAINAAKIFMLMVDESYWRSRVMLPKQKLMLMMRIDMRRVRVGQR